VIRRLYVHNFRCLENFELNIAGLSSLLLIGKNGSGKSTVGLALEVLQRIARGANRVGELVKPKDLTRGNSQSPMRFLLEVELDSVLYEYSVAFEFPRGFKEMRVFQESLKAGAQTIYSREVAQVQLARTETDKGAKFSIDWHLVALPIVQEQSPEDPLFIFRKWLGQLLILRPIPSLITGESKHETLQPNAQVTDFGAWFSGLLANWPASYAAIHDYLINVLPDLREIRNPTVGTDARSLQVQFANQQGGFSLPFEDLSDGEKCFLICGLVLAANKSYGPLFCFWDEPDNYLSIDEVSHFIMAIRQSFQGRGQFIATSHNAVVIRGFSDENTLIVHRKSHLEPTQIRLLNDLPHDGDLVESILRGDLWP
jgi:predicted ATPase